MWFARDSNPVAIVVHGGGEELLVEREDPVTPDPPVHRVGVEFAVRSVCDRHGEAEFFGGTLRARCVDAMHHEDDAGVPELVAFDFDLLEYFARVEATAFRAVRAYDESRRFTRGELVCDLPLRHDGNTQNHCDFSGVCSECVIRRIPLAMLATPTGEGDDDLCVFQGTPPRGAVETV